MQVTNVRVSFLREKQPAQYEKSAPAVEYMATLDDGESHESAARALMISATSVVYNGLGYEVPPKVAAALAKGKVPAELAVATDASAAPEDAPLASEKTVAAKVADAVAPEDDKPKKGGRPKGSKNTGPKKETAKAKRLREEAEAAAEAVPGDDAVPGEEETPKDQISTGEERVDPDAVPGDDEAPANEVETLEFTPKDLHTLIMSHVNATPRTLSVANAKQVLAHFKVARAQDLTDEQALEGKGMVEKMVEAAANA